MLFHKLEAYRVLFLDIYNAEFFEVLPEAYNFKALHKCRYLTFRKIGKGARRR